MRGYGQSASVGSTTLDAIRNQLMRAAGREGPTLHEALRRTPMVLVGLFSLGLLIWITRERGREFEGPDIATLFLSVVTLALLILVQIDTMNEQLRLRLLQTRPQVLVYFEVRSNDQARDRKDIYVVIEHFGGGPALDVNFAFSPALVNHEGHDFSDDPPFSTGIAIMQPRSSIPIRFADFYQYQDDAGGTRLFTSTPLPISFETVVSLRDPLAGDRKYITRYDLDLQHLLDYTMEYRVRPERGEQSPSGRLSDS